MPDERGTGNRALVLLFTLFDLLLVAALASAEAQQNAARLLAERYGPLQERGVVSKQDYDNAVSSQGQAEADVGARAAALRVMIAPNAMRVLRNMGVS